MLSFVSLDQFPFAQLIDVMQRSFEGYFVPIKISEDAWRARCIEYGVDLARSLGVELNGQLVGATFFAYEGDQVYDASTGVVPEGRGHGSTVKLFEYVRPQWESDGIRSVQLEVIAENSAAIKSYEKAGLKIVRTLDLYRVDSMNPKLEIPVGYQLSETPEPNWNLWSNWHEWSPTWQHRKRSWLNRPSGFYLWEVSYEGESVAYLFASKEGRLCQLAVHPMHRRKGIATALLANLARQVPSEINIPNIENGQVAAAGFMNAIGAEMFIQQYEMIQLLSPG